MVTRICLRCFLIGLLACLPVVACAGAPKYQIVDLGSLSGFKAFVPVAINDNKQIVGHMANANNQLHGFLWKNGRFTDLGPGDATGIDRAGQVLMNTMFENYLWDDGVLLPLGEMTSQDNQADSVNDQGDVAGEVGAGGPYLRPYLWRNYVGQVLPLRWPATNPSGFWKADESKTNNQDAIIGRAVPPESDLQYIYLYQNGKTTLILPAAASKAWPDAINSKGWVLGEAKVLNKPTIYAFIWRNGKLTRIGPTTSGSITSALAMNDNGQVIGDIVVTTMVSRTGADMRRSPYLWQGGRLYDLRKLIVNGSGWTNFEMTAMNNKGEIVGAGTYKGQDHAILLTPAEGGK